MSRVAKAGQKKRSSGSTRPALGCPQRWSRGEAAGVVTAWRPSCDRRAVFVACTRVFAHTPKLLSSYKRLYSLKLKHRPNEAYSGLHGTVYRAITNC